MNKLAVFVEGYTESIFVEKLLEEIAGKSKVLIERSQIRGGSSVPRAVTSIKAAKPDTGQQYFVLIYDCGGDHQVKSRIREEHENLTKSGYTRIIGLRDVRPRFTHNEITKLEASLPTYIKTSLLPVEFILAIMEIEAWFLAETTHYPRIAPPLSIAAIKSALGFDPENEDMELRSEPAQDLHRCYTLGGKTYEKRQAQTTINALDYELVYLELSKKFRYLKRLIHNIETFLT